ncbi:MAG: hypothetical protein ACRD21_26730 [Vicinamibacteria bacterium]
MTSRLAAITILLGAGFGPLLAIETNEEARPNAPVPMIAENGRSYLVEPAESLASTMGQGALRQSRPHKETGACVPEPLEKKPEGAVACKCYELTKCKGAESRQCKRHCRKDLCQCCDV